MLHATLLKIGPEISAVCPGRIPAIPAGAQRPAAPWAACGNMQAGWDFQAEMNPGAQGGSFQPTHEGRVRGWGVMHRPPRSSSHPAAPLPLHGGKGNLQHLPWLPHPRWSSPSLPPPGPGTRVSPMCSGLIGAISAPCPQLQLGLLSPGHHCSRAPPPNGAVPWVRAAGTASSSHLPVEHRDLLDRVSQGLPGAAGTGSHAAWESREEPGLPSSPSIRVRVGCAGPHSQAGQNSARDDPGEGAEPSQAWPGGSVLTHGAAQPDGSGHW